MLRNSVLIIITVSLFSIACSQPSSKVIKEPDSGFQWKATNVKSKGFNQSLDSLIKKIGNTEYGYIDEVFISRNDSIVFQKEFKLDYAEISKDVEGKMGCGSNMCKDSSEIHIYNYYHPEYHPYFKTTDLHTMQSITKSVTSTILGAAISQGEINGLDEVLLPYFQDFTLSEEMQEHLGKSTIKDLLTMEFGLDWKESGMSLEEETNVSAMELSEDWVQYVLDLSISNEPGAFWNYSSGASQLLSQIIKASTSKHIDEYGNAALFEKLAIKDYYWKKTPTGLADTEGGLYLAAEDLAKIGLLYLRDGEWDGERILPEGWVEAALGKQVLDIYKDGGKEGYGYQWWITADDEPLAVGLGYGNQILVVIPEIEVVGVIYAWNIFDIEAKYIFRDFVDVLLNLEK